MALSTHRWQPFLSSSELRWAASDDLSNADPPPLVHWAMNGASQIQTHVLVFGSSCSMPFLEDAVLYCLLILRHIRRISHI